MGGSKKMKFNENEEINFNDSSSFEKLTTQFEKGKKGNFSFKDAPKKAIGFLTGNVKSVAIIAAYILLCGIGLNIYWICQIDIFYIIGFVLGIIALVITIKFINKIKLKNKKKK